MTSLGKRKAVSETASNVCHIILDDRTIIFPINETTKDVVENLMIFSGNYLADKGDLLITAHTIKDKASSGLKHFLSDLNIECTISDDYKAHRKSMTDLMSSKITHHIFIIVSDDESLDYEIHQLCKNNKVIVISRSDKFRSPSDIFNLSNFSSNKKVKQEVKAFCPDYMSDIGCHTDKCPLVHKCDKCFTISDNLHMCSCRVTKHGIVACSHSYFCRYGNKCKNYHTERELNVFKQNGGKGYEKRFIQKCRYSSHVEGQCNYYHSIQEIFCPLCGKSNAGHERHECPEMYK